MLTLPSSISEPLWDQFAALIPTRVDTHRLACHRPRIADRVVFDKLIQVLVLGAAYERIADATCSATAIRARAQSVGEHLGCGDINGGRGHRMAFPIGDVQQGGRCL